MIELLLQAERALSMGLVDQAEGLYRQAADADPHNAIAVVGLARVALEHADDAGAYREARRALTIDPENVAALRLVARLEEVFAARGETQPAVEPTARQAGDERVPPAVQQLGDELVPSSEPMPQPSPSPEPMPPSGPMPQRSPSPKPSSSSSSPSNRRSSPPGLIDRLLRRKRP